MCDGGLFQYTAAKNMPLGQGLRFDGSLGAHGYGKTLGGGMDRTQASDMIGEVALVIDSPAQQLVRLPEQ